MHMASKTGLALVLLGVALASPGTAAACTIALTLPPIAGESSNDYQARLAREQKEAAIREKEAAALEQSGWFDNALAIALYRVADPPSAANAAFERWKRRPDSYKKRVPPPRIEIPRIAVYGPRRTHLSLLRVIRPFPATGTRSPPPPRRTLVTKGEIANTTCGPMPSGWLVSSLPDEVHLVFFGNDGGYADRNIVWTVGRDEATDPRIKAIFAALE